MRLKPGEPQTPTPRRMFRRYVAPFKGIIALGIACILAANLAMLAGPVLRELHDGPIQGALPGPDDVHVLHHRRDGGVVGQRRHVLTHLPDRLVQLAEHRRIRRALGRRGGHRRPETIEEAPVKTSLPANVCRISLTIIGPKADSKSQMFVQADESSILARLRAKERAKLIAEMEAEDAAA